MTSLERVTTALRREEPDRVPVLLFTDIGADNFTEELRRHVHRYADAQTDALCSEFSYIAFPAVGVLAEKREVQLPDGWIERTYTTRGREYSEVLKHSEQGYYRMYRKHLLDTIGDVVDAAELPSIEPERNNAFRREMSAIAAHCRIHTRENQFCFFVVHNPLSFLASNTDPENLALWSLVERRALVQYFERILSGQLQYLRYALENYELPVIGMVSGAEYGIPPLLSPADFEEFVSAHDRHLIQEMHRHEKRAIVHCHGRIRRFIEDFIEMGADGIHPLEPVGATGDCDLREIKQLYGKDICLIGNVQYDDFAHGTPDDMDRRVRETIGAAKEGGGFILSPAGPFYHRSLPPQIVRSIEAFVEAGRRYGTYGAESAGNRQEE